MAKTSGNGKLILQWDKELCISVCGSRHETDWKPVQTTLSAFVSKLGRVRHTGESKDDYAGMSAKEKVARKDVGGYLAGLLKKASAGKRDENIQNRHFITLDADHIWDGRLLDNLESALGGVCHTVHSTRKAGCYRVLVYVDVPLLPIHYGFVARTVAAMVGENYFDAVSYKVGQLMFWPSCSADAVDEYYFRHNDAPFLDTAGYLEQYGDGAAFDETGAYGFARQADPLAKEGIVGAFNRSYGIGEVLDGMLPHVYRNEGGGRWTYLEGSTAKGLVVYQDRLAYSNHSTDPAGGGHCRSAWDLVRIHFFGKADRDGGVVDGEVAPYKMPSYIAMEEYARSLPRVELRLIDETLNVGLVERDVTGFVGAGGYDDVEIGWVKELELSKDGRVKRTYDNLNLIIRNDPRFNGLPHFDLFNQDRTYKKERLWSDWDTLELRRRVPEAYHHVDFPKAHFYDAIEAQAYRNPYHPIKNYLEGLEWDGVDRIHTMLQRWLKVEDSVFCQYAQVCWMVAAVRRIYNPGYQFDNILVVCGGQGVGKTSLLRLLAKDKWYVELQTVSRKEVVELALGKWILDFNELGVMKKADEHDFKSFVSSKSTKVRLSYRRDPCEMLHSFVLAGTTNDTEFLTDATGNRRYWPFRSEMREGEYMDSAAFAKEVDQLWAEAFYLERLGFSTSLSEVAIRGAMVSQKIYQSKDPWMSGLEEFLTEYMRVDKDRHPKLKDDARLRFPTIEVILTQHLGFQLKELTRSHRIRVASCLRMLGYEEFKQGRKDRFGNRKQWSSWRKIIK